MHRFAQPKTVRPPDRDDGSALVEYTPLWALRRSNLPVVRLIHEITHFTHPIPDGEDDWGRPRYVTLHRLVTVETEQSLPQDVAECPQFSLQRDRAPSESSWPKIVQQYRRRVINRAGCQVFTRHYVCDDEEYDLEYRRELPSKRTL